MSCQMRGVDPNLRQTLRCSYDEQRANSTQRKTTKVVLAILATCISFSLFNPAITALVGVGSFYWALKAPTYEKSYTRVYEEQRAPVGTRESTPIVVENHHHHSDNSSFWSNMWLFSLFSRSRNQQRPPTASSLPLRRSPHFNGSVPTFHPPTDGRRSPPRQRQPNIPSSPVVDHQFSNPSLHAEVDGRRNPPRQRHYSNSSSGIFSGLQSAFSSNPPSSSHSTVGSRSQGTSLFSSLGSNLSRGTRPGASNLSRFSSASHSGVGTRGR